MCGIVAAVQKSQPIESALFDRQTACLRHRGPDDAGTWFSPDGRVSLGNRRLAIQDLSPAGRMPMVDPSGKVAITFNGEVYNFQVLRSDLERRGRRFSSHSDAEVVLQAYLEWGDACLNSLNGMFAFAVYDGRPEVAPQGRILLARDRAGEKPLYYWRHSHGLVAASELKSLMLDPALPRRIDASGFNAFLALGYVPGEMCILQGVRKLPPAHAAVYDLKDGLLEVRRYWSLPKPGPKSNPDPDGLLDQLQELLLESVASMLVADVPVGVLLSGGLDSSLVTAAAVRVARKPVRTFTIAFPGGGAFDESRHARRVAEWCGTEHHELPTKPGAMEVLPELARQCDEPLADSSLVPTYLVSRLTRQHVTVALGGDGGDELFGGYHHYTRALRRRRLQSLFPRPVRSLVAGGARKLLPVGFRGRQYLSSLQGRFGEGAVRDSLLFDLPSRQRLLQPDVGRLLEGHWSDPEFYKLGLWAGDSCTEAEAMMRLDFDTYLPDDILVKVDRASMAVSLEVRAPWLDPRIIAFAFGCVPSRWKVNTQERKILLRRLAHRFLPPEFNAERKQGFSLPLAAWFRSDWGAFCNEVLNHRESAIFSRRAVASLLSGQRRGFSNTSRVFALVIFELWREHYQVELP